MANIFNSIMFAAVGALIGGIVYGGSGGGRLFSLSNSQVIQTVSSPLGAPAQGCVYSGPGGTTPLNNAFIDHAFTPQPWGTPLIGGSIYQSGNSLGFVAIDINFNSPQLTYQNVCAPDTLSVGYYPVKTFPTLPTQTNQYLIYTSACGAPCGAGTFSIGPDEGFGFWAFNPAPVYQPAYNNTNAVYLAFQQSAQSLVQSSPSGASVLYAVPSPLNYYGSQVNTSDYFYVLNPSKSYNQTFLNQIYAQDAQSITLFFRTAMLVINASDPVQSSGPAVAGGFTPFLPGEPTGPRIRIGLQVLFGYPNWYINTAANNYVLFFNNVLGNTTSLTPSQRQSIQTAITTIQQYQANDQIIVNVPLKSINFPDNLQNETFYLNFSYKHNPNPEVSYHGMNLANGSIEVYKNGTINLVMCLQANLGGGGECGPSQATVKNLANPSNPATVAVNPNDGTVSLVYAGQPPPVFCILPQTYNKTQNKCITPPPPTCTLPQVYNSTQNKCVTPQPICVPSAQPSPPRSGGSYVFNQTQCNWVFIPPVQVPPISSSLINIGTFIGGAAGLVLSTRKGKRGR